MGTDDKQREQKQIYIGMEHETCWELMERAKLMIEQLDGNRQLLGEWYLVYGMHMETTAAGQLEAFQKADALMAGSAEVMSRKFPPYSENPFFRYHLELGKADEEADAVVQAAGLYQKLAGEGQGAGEMFKARLAFSRGELEEAQELAETAFALGRKHGQEHMSLAAAELMCLTARYRGDYEVWMHYMELIRKICDGTIVTERLCREMAEVAYCSALLSLGIIQNIPPWLMEGDFSVVSSPGSQGYRILEDRVSPEILPAAFLQHIQYLTHSGQYIRALNTIDMVQKVYCIGDLPMITFYFDMFGAYCAMKLGQVQRQRECLDRIVTICVADRLWLLLAEIDIPLNGDEVGEAVRQHGEGVFEEFCRIRSRIKGQMEPMREQVLKSGLVV